MWIKLVTQIKLAGALAVSWMSDTHHFIAIFLMTDRLAFATIEESSPFALDSLPTRASVFLIPPNRL